MKEMEASTLFLEGLNCAQAVFSSRASAWGLDAGVALRVASAFGAGMGRKQEVCGAVTGALMALGLEAGYTEASDKAGKERVYLQARTLQDQFTAVHGSVICRDLLGVDLLTPEGQAAFGTRNLGTTVCAACVATADRLVQELIQENL